MSTPAMLKVNLRRRGEGRGRRVPGQDQHGIKEIANIYPFASRAEQTCAAPNSHMTRIGSQAQIRDRNSPHGSLLSVTSHSSRKLKSRKPCTWDLLPYAYPIGRISSAAHCGTCTAEAVMPSDHQHHPRLSQTRHGVMHHHSCPSVSGHFQSVATPMPARCHGLRNLIFGDILQPH